MIASSVWADSGYRDVRGAIRDQLAKGRGKMQSGQKANLVEGKVTARTSYRLAKSQDGLAHASSFVMSGPAKGQLRRQVRVAIASALPVGTQIVVGRHTLTTTHQDKTLNDGVARLLLRKQQSSKSRATMRREQAHVSITKVIPSQTPAKESEWTTMVGRAGAGGPIVEVDRFRVTKSADGANVVHFPDGSSVRGIEDFRIRRMQQVGRYPGNGLTYSRW